MSTGLKCHALVIGINDYGGGISPLQSAVQDATAIAGILRSQHDYEVTCFQDDEAVGNAIVKHLTETLPDKLSPESGFLLYFAGHGVAIGDGTKGPQGYLLPQDAKPADEDNWISMETLRAALEALPCRHLLIILDCCFAGAFRWASTRGMSFGSRPLYQSQFKRYLQGDAWQALTSASHDQRAADLSPGRNNKRDTDGLEGHSPFAAALIRGLAGGADSSRAGFEPDGVITATELYQYIFEELMPQEGKTNQTPGIWPLKPDNEGEFIFLNPTAKLNTVPDPPLDDKNNPWLGLEAYSMGQTNLFFGRQRVIDDLLDRVLDEKSTSLLAVVGASGTGKSSVVKAGLLPLLANPPDKMSDRIGQWSVIQAPRLTANPGQQLDEVLKKLSEVAPGHKSIVLIDQFEELYTQCPDNDVRNNFLERMRALIRLDDGPTVLITLRSDFEPRPASAEFLQDIWQRARFVVPAFSHEELREVIEGPANVKAIFFEPVELVSKLLDEIVAMPGALPLLSFALAEIYRHAQLRRREEGSADRALTLKDYEDTGGVVGALHKRATLLYENADEKHRDTIRRVFLRMLSQDGARLTRRRVHLSELGFGDDVEQARVDSVVKWFVDARLLVIDGEFVEPAHDTLVVAWEKLQDWLAAAGSQELIRSVWRDAKQWQTHVHEKSASGFLWNNDPRLPQMETKLSELNRLEQEFVLASTARKKRQRNWTIGITASVIAILIGATIFSYLQFSTANTERRAALVQLGNAQWERAVSTRDYEQDDVRAAHLFATSAKAFDEAEEAQLAANSLSAVDHGIRDVVATFPNDESVLTALFNDDESRVISWTEDGTVMDWNVAMKEPPKTFRHDVEVGSDGALFFNNMTRVLSWRYDGGIVQIWDVARTKPLKTFKHGTRVGSGWGVGGALLDAKESRVLSWTDAGKVWLWDVTQSDQGEPINTFSHPGLSGADFGGDDRILSWSYDGGSIRLWKSVGNEPGEDSYQSFFHEEVSGATFDTKQSTLLSWGDNSVKLWRDISSAEPEPAATLSHKRVKGANFYSGSSNILSWDFNGMVRLWVYEGKTRTFKHEVTAPVVGASLNHDESKMLSWYEDGTVQLWDTDDERLIKTFRHAAGTEVLGASFSSEDARVLSWGADGTVRLWDTRSERPLKTFDHANVIEAMFNSDESNVLSWNYDGTVRLWGIDGGIDGGLDQAVDPPKELIHPGIGRALLPSYPQVSSVVTSVDDKSAGDYLEVISEAEDEGVGIGSDEDVVLEVIVEAEGEGAGLGSDEDVVLEVIVEAEGEGAGLGSGEDVVLEVIVEAEGEGAGLGSGEDVVLEVIVEAEGEGAGLGSGEDVVLLRGALFKGEDVITWDDNGRVHLWDLNTTERPEKTFEHGDGATTLGLQVSKDRSRVLSWGYDNRLRLADIANDEAPRSFKYESFLGASVNDDGSNVLSWHENATIRLWDGSKSFTFSDNDGDWMRGALLIGGQEPRVLGWGDKGKIRVWGFDQQEEPRETFGLDVQGALVNGNESKLISWHKKGTVQLWDISADAKKLKTFQHRGVVGAAFNGDGSRMLSWGDDTVRFWDLDQDAPLKTLSHDRVQGALLNRCESRVLSWGRDGTVRLWEMPNNYNVSTDCPGAIRNDVDVVTLELEVRTAATINDQGAFRLLSYDEWLKKQDQLAARKNRLPGASTQ